MGKYILPAHKTAEQAELLSNRLRKRKRHLAKWARRAGTSVYRLYDRDIPEIPLVLDYYEGTRENHPVRALFGALYKRPYEKDPAEEDAWLTAMKSAAARTLELDENQVFIKVRQRNTPDEQYRKAARQHQSFIMDVQEGGLSFRVNLSDYIDSGLFHDARKVRAMVYAAAQGKKALNLFCYTAAFSVSAAAGGAAFVDSVDMSAVCLERAAVNFALNGFTAQFPAPNQTNARYRLIRADVLRFLENPLNNKWDIIILNPPSFSNSKKMGQQTFDIQRDCGTLIKRTLKLLAPGGQLYFGAANRAGSLNNETAAGLQRDFPALSIVDITEKTRSEDFAKRKIPSWWIISGA